MRLFIGLEATALGPELAAALPPAGLAVLARGRRVPTVNLHMTLVFIANASPEAARALGERLCQASALAAPASLRFGALAGFPSAARATVLTVEPIAPPAALFALAAACRSMTDELGIAHDQRAFRPHVTIGRFRAPVDASAASEQPLTRELTLATPALRLYRSVSGAPYQVLAQRPDT